MSGKSALAAIAGAMLAATSLVASAWADIPPRSVSLPYEHPQGFVVTLPTGGAVGGNLVLEHPAVEAKRGERSISVTISDDAGGTPRGGLFINFDRDREFEVQESFCGSTSKPVRVRPGAEIEVRVYAGLCDDGSPALASRGTIDITFHR